MALDTNLVSYWKLDESSGTAIDAIGSNSLTNTSASYGSGSGKINNGASFNGSSSKLEKTSASGLSFGTGAFSISAWFNLQGAGTGGSNGNLINMDNGGSTPRIWIDGESGTGGMTAQFYDGTHGAATTYTPPSTTWTHIVFMRDASSNAKFYVNGSLSNTNNSTFGTPASCNLTISQIKLGASYEGGAGFYQGYLDEVGIWSRDLTGAEITSLYNGGAGFQYPFTSPAAKRRFRSLLGVGR
jgi:hypothetical protein